MSEDKYFKNKAKEINDKIYSDKKELTAAEIEHIIYLGLKEVARDQRYACIDSINSMHNGDGEYFRRNQITGIIQNAMIKGE